MHHPHPVISFALLHVALLRIARLSAALATPEAASAQLGVTVETTPTVGVVEAKNKSSAAPVGAIVGGVIGGLLALAAIVLAIFVVKKKKSVNPKPVV